MLYRSGDMIAAHAAGVGLRDKSVSLSALLGARSDAPVAAGGITLFKSVGGGIQDVAVAEMVLERAIAAGKAVPLPMAFETKIRT